MSWENLLLMQQEVLLILVALALLLADLLMPNTKKQSLIPVAIILFTLHTLAGFLPASFGELFGGSFRVTPLHVMMKNILNIGVLILLLQTADWLKKEVFGHERGTEFFFLLFTSLTGMYFMISAGDFLMFYIGLELSTLPIAALAAYEVNRLRSSEAALKLILSAALASGVSLMGISFIYAVGGSIFFDTLQLTPSPLLFLGLLMFIAGLGFKISLVPFHFWTADVYEGAPISIASYLSVISKGAAVFILVLILFTVGKSLYTFWENIIYVLALITMTLGNLFALRQENMKRFLAFSSVAQAGFILLGVLNGSHLGLVTVLYFVLIYIFSNLAAFGVVQAISQKTGKENRSDYEGLYRTNPKLSLVMMFALFSLAGIPPMAGFFGKFFLFAAAAEKGFYLLVFIAVANATISLYYYLLVVRAMFLRKSEQALPYFKSSPYMRTGLILALLGILTLGLYSPLFDHLSRLGENFMAFIP